MNIRHKYLLKGRMNRLGPKIEELEKKKNLKSWQESDRKRNGIPSRKASLKVKQRRTFFCIFVLES